MLGAVIELCRVFANLFSNAAHVKHKTKSLALPYGLGSITVLTLLFFAGVEQTDIIWVAIVLTTGASIMLVFMMILMRRLVKTSLDGTRCCAGAMLMFIMGVLSYWAPTAIDWRTAIGMLALASIIAALATFALLWKNPATLRLIKVHLRRG
jgi:hypothetical protein